jgi:nucleoside-diphosphate kinase
MPLFPPGSALQFDLKNRRTFLSRCVSPGVRPADLYQGGIVTVYARQLTVVEYGDAFTAAAYSRKTQMCAAPPASAARGGAVRA